MVKIELTIVKAVCITGSGTDKVCLRVDRPSPYPFEVDSSDLVIEFNVQKGRGAEYCRLHFGINVEVIHSV